MHNKSTVTQFNFNDGNIDNVSTFTSINFPNVKTQGFYNNNNYNYYNNYQDNDMYSKSPTEVNQYECQKGPCEGFFVSSVEFCKKYQ